MKFNKIYESLFKPASDEEVKERKKHVAKDEFYNWVEMNVYVKPKDIFKLNNINERDSGGNTALMIAVKKECIDIVTKLLKSGANVNLKNFIGYTAIDYAKKINNKKIIELLKQYGAKK